MSHKVVSYYRVSTRRQGDSGLGLEAQRADVRRHLQGAAPIAEFVEIESGSKDASERPELDKALATCRAHGAVLVVAKLDRLARNVEFTARLMNSGVRFIACDNPHANELTIHILAAMAEHERKQISARTKAALSAAKARGVKLGAHRDGAVHLSDDIRVQGRAKAVKVVASKATSRASDLACIIDRIKAEGITSASAIAKRLTVEGVPTPRGGTTWQATQVQRVLARAA